MEESEGFYYVPNPTEALSTEVVNAIAQAHDEDIIEQKWRISDDIDTDSLDGLFQDHNLGMTLQFEADTTTVTIVSEEAADWLAMLNPTYASEYRRSSSRLLTSQDTT